MANLYVIKPETEKEILAVNDLLIKMREEEYHKERVQFHKNSISFEIADAIGELGLEEVKRIVRELNKELRELKQPLNKAIFARRANLR